MTRDGGQPLADDRLSGSAWCRRHTELVDQWLAGAFQHATGATGVHAEGVALVAIGGYGRSELCPQSDLDLMLLHDRGAEVTGLADAIWYPIWDEGIHLGHSVCTPREALDLAATDLESATAMLSVRLVARGAALGDQ